MISELGKVPRKISIYCFLNKIYLFIHLENQSEIDRGRHTHRDTERETERQRERDRRGFPSTATFREARTLPVFSLLLFSKKTVLEDKT